MKFIKIMLRRPIIFVAILILVLFLPSGLAAPPEGLDFIHATSVGIDTAEEGVEVSILAFVVSPSKNYSESFYFLSAKAQNPAQAVDLIASSVGKRVVLANAGIVVVGKPLAESGVIEELNYLFRSHTIANDVFLITTNVMAKEILQAEQKMIADAGIRLEELGIFEQKNYFFNDINLESFYKGYFSPTKVSVTAYIELLPEQEASQILGSNGASGGSSGAAGNAMGGMTGGAGGASEGQEKSQETKYIQNTTRAAVFYRGILQTVLTETETKGINWTSPTLKNTSVLIQDVQDENFSGGDLVFKVEGVEVRKNGYFVNHQPVIDFSVLLIIDIEEALRQVDDLSARIASGKTYLTKTVGRRIEAQVKSEFSEGLKAIVESKTDVLEVFKILQTKAYFKTKNWLKTLSEDEQRDFLRFIDVRMTVSVRSSR